MPMDTTEFLTAQGWKGKGTALKQGHMTRPIAVVQKKTLSGVGKDRDEAVPFWDNIFAAAALNIKVASQTPTPAGSGTATPIKDASPAPKQQTHARSSMSAFARSKQEMARRILYSKFLRGEVVTNEDIEKTPGLPARLSNALAAEAGSSTVTPSEVSVSQNTPMASPSCQPSTTSPVTDNKETKEERRKRRAEKAAKKAAKSGKAEERQAKLESRAERKSRKLAQASSASDGESKRTSKKGKAKKRDTEVGLIAEAENHAKDRKRKRDRQGTHVDTQGTDARGTQDADGKLGTKKKRKTKSGDTSAS